MIYPLSKTVLKVSTMKTKLRRKTVSLLNMKPKRFLLSCFVFLACFTIAFAQGTPSQDPAEEALDFEALLAAIKQTNTPLKSGEGVVVHISGEPPLDIDPRIVTLRIVFDSEKYSFRFTEKNDYPYTTTMWEIVRRNGKPDYYFSTKPQSYHEHMDPRRFLTWVDEDLATHLRKNDFHIIGREVFNGTLCYVLEAKQEDRSKRIWIAPERGFRHLKYESQQPTPVDALDSDIPMEALTVFRTTITYQQHGEIWFPKAVFVEYAWLDFKPADPIISQRMLEIKNFKLNHNLPPETFIVDLPNDAMIKVDGISKALTKQEFLKRYGQQ